MNECILSRGPFRIINVLKMLIFFFETVLPQPSTPNFDIVHVQLRWAVLGRPVLCGPSRNSQLLPSYMYKLLQPCLLPEFQLHSAANREHKNIRLYILFIVMAYFDCRKNNHLWFGFCNYVIFLNFDRISDGDISLYSWYLKFVPNYM